jgi:ketosteroid isomerase-like protein
MRLMFAAAALAVTISAPAAAQDTREEVNRASTAWNEAIRAADAAAAERFMAPEYALAFGDGANPVPRAVWLRNLAGMKMHSYTTRIADLRMHGPFAVATVEGEWDVEYQGRRMKERFLVRDVWVRRDGRWQVFRRHRPE